MDFFERSFSTSTWPLGALYAFSVASSRTKNDQKPTSSAPFVDHLSMQVACIPRLILVYFIYEFYGDWREYGKVYSPSWIVPIVARDVLLCLFVGCVDSFLLLSEFSPFKKSMARFKYHPSYPSLMSSMGGTSSLFREAFLCCCSAAIAGLMEAGVIHAYATGGVQSLAARRDSWWEDGWTLFFMFTWFYSQNVQFYTMHRLLHKWGIPGVPDLGQFLYTHVHSWHHASKIPTAFSGISMHPLESTLYFSYALLPCIFGAHPVAFLYIKINLISAAMLGHSAFCDPGTGSMPHYLHHSLVSVNYAENHLPLDAFFGTWAATEEEAEESINRRFLAARKTA